MHQKPLKAWLHQDPLGGGLNTPQTLFLSGLRAREEEERGKMK